MKILPAIDLKDGKVVRLLKGDFDTTHQVAEDPLAVARVFRESGAQEAHIVDLDGALDGVRKNAELVRRLAQQGGLGLELGGGIRTLADLETVFSLGVARAVIGSAAVTDRAFVREAVLRYGAKISVGIDAKDGKVRTHGWTVDAGIDALAFAQEMEALGVQNIIYTDIETDGTLAGPPLAGLKRLRDALHCTITASGGVKDLADVLALRALGVDAAIVGKAFYAGTIDLREAVARCSQNA